MVANTAADLYPFMVMAARLHAGWISEDDLATEDEEGLPAEA